VVREEGAGLARRGRRDQWGTGSAEGAVEGEEGEAAGSFQAEGAVRAGRPGAHVLGQGGRQEVVVCSGVGEVRGGRPDPGHPGWRGATLKAGGWPDDRGGSRSAQQLPEGDLPQ
jgi:hypothetical protein